MNVKAPLLAVCLLASIAFIVVLTWQPPANTTRTTVNVSEGSVEVSSLSDPSRTERLRAGESAVASNGELQAERQAGDVATASAEIVASASMIAAATSESNSAAADASIEIVTKEEYWVAGYAYSVDGKAISDAVVKANLMEKERWKESGTTKTNAEGYYNLRLDQIGRYWLDSTPPEDFLQQSAQIVIAATESSVVHNFSHAAAGLSVHGVVLNKNTNEPVAGAEVTLDPVYQEAHKDQRQVKGKTDAAGHFNMRRIAPGYFSFAAKADGYVSMNAQQMYDSPSPLARVQINEKTQEQEYEIKLDPAYAAKIRVVNAQKQPVEGAEIQVHNRSTYLSDCRGKSDARGELLLNNIPEGSAVVRVKKEKLGEAVSDLFEPGPKEQPALVEVTLSGASTVEGTVKDKDGKAVTERRLFAMNQEIQKRLGQMTSGITLEEARTDSSGKYQFKNLGQGSYRISVQTPDNDNSGWQDLASKELELEAAEQRTGVDFVIEDVQGTEEIKGKVVDNQGQPVSQVSVSVTIMNTSVGNSNISSHGSAQTNEQGEFLIKGLTKSTVFHLSAWAKGYDQYQKQFDMNGEYLTITLLSSGSISGIVLEKETRKPIGGAQVELEGSRNRYGRPITAMSLSDGTFLMEDVQNGPYRIKASSENRIKSDGLDVQVEQGQKVENILIELEQGVELKGLVLDPEQKPVGQTQIALQTNVQSVEPYRRAESTMINSTVSAGDGTFILKGVNPRGDTIVLRHRNFATTLFKVTPEMLKQEIMPIHLNRGGIIEGRVVDENEKPVKGSAIQVYAIPQGLTNENAVTDDNGEYRVERLMAGTYQVMQQKNQKQAHVEEGKTVRVDFGSGEGAVIRGVVYRGNQVVPEARIMLSPGTMSISPIRMSTISKRDGTYTIKGVPSGEYLILVSSQTSSDYLHPGNAESMTSVSIAPEQKEIAMDLYIQNYPIHGIVKDRQTGQPLAKAKISAQINANNLQGGVYMPPVESDASGVFTMQMKAPGHYSFTADKEGYIGSEFSIAIEAGSQPDTPRSVEVTLEPGELSLLVHLFENGKPVTDANIQFISFEGPNMQQIQSKPDNSGAGVFRINSGLKEGSVNLIAVTGNQNRQLFGQALNVPVQRGSVGTVVINMLIMTIYSVTLQPSDKATINGPYESFIEGAPFQMQLPMMNTVRSNTLIMGVFKGHYKVRLKVPGYRQVEFFPDEMASTLGGGDSIRSIALPIVKE